MMELNIYPYCNCFARGQWRRQDGYTKDLQSGIWIHSRCHKPSKMNYERLVLGKPQIPQTAEVDIYKFEAEYESRKMARKEVATELDWEDDPEDDYSYN